MPLISFSVNCINRLPGSFNQAITKVLPFTWQQHSIITNETRMKDVLSSVVVLKNE